MRKSVKRCLILALAGIAALVLGQATAYAWYTEYIPASTPGGIGASPTKGRFPFSRSHRQPLIASSRFKTGSDAVL